VGEVHQENQAEKDKNGGANERDIASPEYKEAIRNEEGHDNNDKPE
jgi:hypothetical protein